LRLDERQRRAEPFVLHNRRVADALILVEGDIGQRYPFPTNLHPSIGKVIDLDMLSDRALSDVIALQHDPLPLIRQRQLLPHVALLAMAEDVAKATC
jgi:aspartate oxidase